MSEQRENNLKRLRETNEKVESTPLLLKKAKVVAEPPISKDTMDVIYHWDKSEGTMEEGKKRDGNMYVKYVKDRKKCFNMLCEMTVVESCMYEFGDLNVPVWNDWQKKDDTVTNPQKAKYTMVLKPGYPDHMADRAEKMGDRQKECMKWIDEKYHQMMDFARDHDIVKCSEAAQASIYTYYDMSYCFAKNDTVTLKRSVCDWNQCSTPVRYWKKKKDGTFGQFYPTELPADSVVMASVNFKFYNFQDNGNWKHGVSGELGKDIIVVWMPKARTVDEIEKEHKEKRQAIKDKVRLMKEDATDDFVEDEESDPLADIPIIDF